MYVTRSGGCIGFIRIYLYWQHPGLERERESVCVSGRELEGDRVRERERDNETKRKTESDKQQETERERYTKKESISILPSCSHR